MLLTSKASFPSNGLKTITQNLSSIHQEQENALRAASGYKKKLIEATNFISRLEAAYMDVVDKNGKLRAKVNHDSAANKQLDMAVEKLKHDQKALAGQVENMVSYISTLESDQSKLRSAREKAESDAKALGSAFQSVQGTALALENELSEARNNYKLLEDFATHHAEQSEAERLQLQQKLDGASARIDSLTKDLEKQTALANSLQKDYEELKKSFDQADAQLKVKEAEVKELNEQLTAAKGALETANQSHAKALKDLQDQHKTALDAAGAELEKAKKDAEEEKKKALDELTAANGVAAELARQEMSGEWDEKKKTYEEQIAKLTSERDQLQKVAHDAAAAATAAEEYKQKVEALNLQIEKLTSERNTLSDQLSTANAAASDADQKHKQEVTGLRQQIAANENKLDQHGSSIRTLEQEKKTLQDAHAALQQQYSALEATARGYEGQIAQLDYQLARVKTELDEKVEALKHVGSFCNQQKETSVHVPTLRTAKPPSSMKRHTKTSPPSHRHRGKVPHTAFQDSGRDGVARNLSLEHMVPETEVLHDVLPETEPQSQDDDGWDDGYHGHDDYQGHDGEYPVEAEDALALVPHGAKQSRHVRAVRQRSQPIVEEAPSDDEGDDGEQDDEEEDPHYTQQHARAVARNRPVQRKPAINHPPRGALQKPAARRPQPRLAALRPASSMQTQNGGYRKPSTALGPAGGVKKWHGASSKFVPHSQPKTLFAIFGGLTDSSPGNT